MRNIMLAVCLAACCYSSAYAGKADSLDIFRTVDLREVIVSVNREQTRKINTPQHIVNVPKSFIDYANKQSTADLLGETGHVLVQKSQQGGGSPILRGFEASRILLVVDGIRMNNLIYRSGHLQNCLTVDQFAGLKDYDDPMWEDLLDQLSIEDMRTLYTDGAYRVASVKSIGMKLTVDADSGVGLNGTSISAYGVKAPSPQIWASTFNDELIERLAQYIGYDFLLAGAVGVYGPSCNLMRSPFNGRNGEYMSEDPLLTGKITAAYDRGIQGVGCYVYNKHYAVYGCAGNASSMVWVNEQALREVYLRHFEIAVKEGDAMGMMVSFARIGTSLNTCAYPLLTVLPREEWGFMGAYVSDGISTEAWNQDLGVLAGLDLVLDASVDSGMTPYDQAIVSDRVTDSIYGQHMMRESAKRLIYRYCNSAASTAIRDFTPTWIIFVVLFNLIFAAGIVCCIIFMIKPAFFPKKDKTTA